jgi:hypothetical protein
VSCESVAAAFALDAARPDDFFLLLAMERCSLDAADARPRRTGPRVRTVA